MQTILALTMAAVLVLAVLTTQPLQRSLITLKLQDAKKIQQVMTMQGICLLQPV